MSAKFDEWFKSQQRKRDASVYGCFYMAMANKNHPWPYCVHDDGHKGSHFCDCEWLQSKTDCEHWKMEK